MTTSQTHQEPKARFGDARAFGATVGILAEAYPGLRHERSGPDIEWFLRVSRPLAGDGLPLDCAFVLDMPCDEDTSALLDAIAFSNDPTLGRLSLDAAMRREAAYLSERLDHAVDFARRLAKRDLGTPGIDRAGYLRALKADLSQALELFPAGCEDKGRHYRPSQHVRDRVRAACQDALRQARRHGAKGKRHGSGPGRDRPGRRDARPQADQVRTGRPIRMRRWSPLYE